MRLASASQPACLGVQPERQPVLWEWPPVLGSAACARVLRRAVACPAAAVLQQAAGGGAGGVGGRPPPAAAPGAFKPKTRATTT